MAGFNGLQLELFIQMNQNIKTWLLLFRVKQWVKNGLIFAALLFSKNVFNFSQLRLSIFAFVAFCAVSSSVYIFNDILDFRSDQNHPIKKFRPIANSDISKKQGLIVAILLLVIGMLIGIIINVQFTILLSVYVLINIGYSLVFKKIVMLDILIVSMGFVLRAIGGALAINVVFSNWLLVTTLYLALFLVLGKRRNELIILGEEAKNHRKILGEYSQSMLDSLIMIVAAASLVSYSLYTLNPTTISHFGTENLIYTLPIVIYGLFRYLYLIYKRHDGADPSNTLYSDVPLLSTVLIWGVVVAVILYIPGVK